MSEDKERVKYRVVGIIKEDKKNNPNIKRQKFFDPNNPYQLISMILRTKDKSRKN